MTGSMRHVEQSVTGRTCRVCLIRPSSTSERDEFTRCTSNGRSHPPRPVLAPNHKSCTVQRKESPPRTSRLGHILRPASRYVGCPCGGRLVPEGY